MLLHFTRLNNPNAVFMLRDGSFLDELDKTVLHRFTDSDAEAHCHMKVGSRVWDKSLVTKYYRKLLLHNTR